MKKKITAFLNKEQIGKTVHIKDLCRVMEIRCKRDEKSNESEYLGEILIVPEINIILESHGIYGHTFEAFIKNLIRYRTDKDLDLALSTEIYIIPKNEPSLIYNKTRHRMDKPIDADCFLLGDWEEENENYILSPSEWEEESNKLLDKIQKRT